MSQQCFTLDANYESKKKQLFGILDECSQQAASLGKPGSLFIDKVNRIKSKLNGNAFRVLVLGAFNNGKSTFINALLGKKFLPTSNLPCTLAISSIKYSEYGNDRVIITFNDNVPYGMPEINPRVNDWIDRFEGKIPPLELSIDEAKKAVRIPKGELSDEDKAKINSLYKELTYFSNSELLKSGVEIIDSPGFGEDAAHDAITFGYVDNADAFVLIIDGTRVGSAAEVEAAKNYIVGKEQACFVVVNKIDSIEDDDDDDDSDSKEKAIQETIDRARRISRGFSAHPVYPLAARKALKAKKNEDSALLDKSGMPKLEKDLFGFLTGSEIASVRFMVICQNGQQIIEKCLEEVCNQELILQQQYNQLKSKDDDIKSKAQRIKGEIDNIIERMKRTSNNDFYDRIENKANGFFFDIYASKVSEWLKTFTPKTELTSWSRKSTKEEENKKLLYEVESYINGKITMKSNEWQREQFSLRVMGDEQHIFGASIIGQLDDLLISIKELENTVLGIRKDRKRYKGDNFEYQSVSGSIHLDASISDDVSLSDSSRIGNSIQGVTAAAGVTAMLAQAGTSIVVTTAAGVTTVALAPIAAVAAVGAGIWALVDVSGSSERRIQETKEKIKAKYYNGSAETSRENAKKVADNFRNGLIQRINSIKEELYGRVDTIIKRMDDALKTLECGNEQQRLAELQKIRFEFNSIKAKFERFSKELKVKKA